MFPFFRRFFASFLLISLLFGCYSILIWVSKNRLFFVLPFFAFFFNPPPPHPPIFKDWKGKSLVVLILEIPSDMTRIEFQKKCDEVGLDCFAIGKVEREESVSESR